MNSSVPPSLVRQEPNDVSDKELTQLEELIGTFDRGDPSASLNVVRFEVELLGCVQNEDGEWEDTEEYEDLFPKFLGHAMPWWPPWRGRCLYVVMAASRTKRAF